MFIALHVDVMSQGERGANDRTRTGSVKTKSRQKKEDRVSVLSQAREDKVSKKERWEAVVTFNESH